MSPTEVPTFVTLPTITQNPRVPLAAIVTFTTNTDVITTLSVTDGKHSWEHRFDLEAQFDSETGLPIVGMHSDTAHEITVQIENEQGQKTYAETLHYRTPEIPKDNRLFPPIEVTLSEPEAMEPGITLMMSRRRPGGQPEAFSPEERRFISNYSLILGFDAEGEIIWYYEFDSRVVNMVQLDNGNLIFLGLDYKLHEIDVLGNERNSWYAQHRPYGADDKALPIDVPTIHHSFSLMPNGNIAAFTAHSKTIKNYYADEFDPDAPRQAQKVMGDRIIEFERDTGKIVWSWDTFDWLDPFRIGYLLTFPFWDVRGFPKHLDWTHGNGIHYYPQDDAFFFSFRSLSCILKVSRKTGEIIWILGDHTGWEGDFKEKLLTPIGEPFEWQYYQHEPKVLADGNLLLYDNHMYGAIPFNEPIDPTTVNSRAVIYRIDEDEMTIEQIWESETHDRRKAWTFGMGYCSEMPLTKNILIGYGSCIPHKYLEGIDPYHVYRAIDHMPWTCVREVKRDNPTTIVFEAILENPEDAYNGWVCFGVERVPKLL